jgi:ATP synthase protein I
VVATAATAAVGAVVVGVAAIAGGAAASYGALAGTLLALVVLAFGSFAVDAVARLMPAASLLFALLTYVFQVVLMALFFVALQDSGLLDETLDRTWLGAAIIVGVLAWSAAQIRASVTARIPAFETTGEQPVKHPVEAARPAPEGGA